jgi:hypothetical protein
MGPSDSPSVDATVESLSHSLCQNFAVFAGTTITFDGVTTTIHSGDVGVFPGTSITGSYVIENGTISTANDSENFASSLLPAHTAAMAARSNTTTISEIGGLTFTPGTYRSGSAINLAAGSVTLDGLNQPNPVFLFQAVTTLVTGGGTSFNLINGATSDNVVWALGTSASLGGSSVLKGSILAKAAITFGTQSELRGCALAINEAVTFASEGSVN